MEDVERRLTKTEEQTKSAHKRLDDLGLQLSRLNDLVVAFTKIDTKMEAMAKGLTSIEERLSEIEKQPAKKWDRAAAQVIALLISCAVGYFINKYK